MSERSKLLFITLTICGTICILGALITAASLYQMNVASLTAPATGSESSHRDFLFATFAAGPAFVTLATGIGMVTVGVKAILKDDSA
jgi:hypothetical protein